MLSISRQIRSAETLLDCLDAVRHGPALASLSCGLVAAGLLIGLAGRIAYEGAGLAAVACALLALAIAFYAMNVAGVLLMDEARGHKPRPITRMLSLALHCAGRLLAVLLLLGLTYAAGALFLSLILVICKLPWLGPVLYTLVMPVAVLAVGLALVALPTVVLPLAGSAVWDGADAVQCAGRLLAIARARLVSVVVMMLMVTLLAAVVGALVMFVVTTGASVVAGLSLAILGVDLSMSPLGSDARWDVGSGSHLGAGVIGGVAVAAIAMVMPGLVYLRGACSVYLVHEDVVHAHEDELYARPQQSAGPAVSPIDTATTPGVLVRPSSKSAGMATTASMAHSPEEDGASGVDVDLPLDEAPAPSIGTFARGCPACGRFVLRDDRYCGHCGAPLPRQS